MKNNTLNMYIQLYRLKKRVNNIKNNNYPRTPSPPRPPQKSSKFIVSKKITYITYLYSIIQISNRSE